MKTGVILDTHVITELSVRCSDRQEAGGDLEAVEGASYLAEGIDACTVGKHWYPLSLDEGQRSCSLAAYHRQGNTPLGARR